MTILEPTSTAIIDTTGTYRYHLVRVWNDGPRLLFHMINPSTADASANDPTIVRCIGFAKREGCGGIEVVNQYALRATDPAEVGKHRSPIGPENDRIIREVATDVTSRGGKIVVAWGPKPWARQRIGYVVREILRPYPLYCLGVSKDGSPRHPLMVRLDQPLMRWPA
jgi:hypothetical protein